MWDTVVALVLENVQHAHQVGEGVGDYLCYFVEALAVAAHEEGERFRIRFWERGERCRAWVALDDIVFVVYGVDVATMGDLYSLLGDVERVAVEYDGDQDIIIVPVLVARSVEPWTQKVAESVDVEVVTFEA